MKTNKTFQVEDNENPDIKPVKIQATTQINLDKSANNSELLFDALNEDELIYKIKFELEDDELDTAKKVLFKKFGKKI